MNKGTVYQLFVATYHPEPGIHKQAELNIRKIEAQTGFLPTVLEILSDQDLEIGARQAASIYFKNCVSRNWTTSISSSDKEIVKQSLLRVLHVASPLLRVQITSSLYAILDAEFPEKWPDFVNIVLQYLQVEDSSHFYTGLLALRELIRVYQWRSQDNLDLLPKIIAETFPTLQNVASRLIQVDTLEATEMLKIAFKIYYASIKFELAECLQETSSLIQWGTLFIQAVEKSVSPSCLPGNLTEREAHPHCKLKKWAIHCLNRLFGKYGNPALLPRNDSRYKSFAKSFVTNFAPNILQAYLSQIEQWVNKQTWLSKRSLALIAQFLDDCIKHKTTWQLVKPHTEALVSQFIFPSLCFSQEEEYLWRNDPVDYVHKRLDPLDDNVTPQGSAIHLLQDLAHDRRKHTFMNMLNFINQVLNQYLETPKDQKSASQKDGALRMVSCLVHEILRKKSPVSSMMELFFVTHVFPEFNSEFPFLRARACEVTSRFGSLEFANEANLGILYENLLRCLQDSELPVRVQAALGLQSILCHENVREAISKDIPVIMQEFLNLTNAIDADILSNVMQEFIEIFAAQVTPFAVEIATQLRNTWSRLLQDLSNQETGLDQNDEEKSAKILAIMGIMRSINSLVLGLEASSDTLVQVQHLLLPVFINVLENRTADIYPELMEMVDTCIGTMQRVEPDMWKIYELLYATRDIAVEYMPELSTLLEHYIEMGSQVFCTREDYKRIAFELIENVLNKEFATDKDRTCACRLIQYILLTCRGSVDQYLEPFLSLAFQYIFTGSMKTVEFKVQCLEVVVTSLYYNPKMTLKFLDQNHWTQGFFTAWFSALDKFTRVQDKKLVILALCEVLELPAADIPDSVKAGWPQILVNILSVFRTLPDALQHRQELESWYRDMKEEGIEDYVVDEADDDEATTDELSRNSSSLGTDNDDGDGDIHDSDNEYLEFLAEQVANNNKDGSGGEGDAEEEDEDLEEELSTIGVLKDFDPYIRFMSTFNALRENSPESYTVLTSSLTSEIQSHLMDVLSIGEAHTAGNS